MFVINDDLSINITRGDTAVFTVNAVEESGENYLFQKGDVLRIKVTEKKACENVMFQKDFVVEEETETVEMLLTEEDTKIGEVISKPTDYWYEVELNPLTNPQTIIGYDDDGAKIFKLFPEGKDVEPSEDITPEDIPLVDEELDLTSERPVQNHVIARAMLNMQEEITKLKVDNDLDNMITKDDLKPLENDIATITGNIEDLSSTLDMHTTDANNPHNVAASQTSFDKNISGMSANSVQGAIDELKSTVGYSKKNLIPYPYVHQGTKIEYGITFTDNGDGTITANGTKTESTSASYIIRSRSETSSNKLVLQAGTYTFNGCPQGGSSGSSGGYYIQIGATNEDGSYLSLGEDIGNGCTFTLTKETQVQFIISVHGLFTLNNLTFKPMLRYASIEDDTFESYVPDLKDLLTPKVVTNNYGSGITHQSGDSYVVGNMLLYSKCIKITSDITKNTNIITDIKCNGKVITAPFTYGVMLQNNSSGAIIPTKVVIKNNEIFPEVDIKLSNGAYPSIMITAPLL